jgi:hypothetical protein
VSEYEPDHQQHPGVGDIFTTAGMALQEPSEWDSDLDWGSQQAQAPVVGLPVASEPSLPEAEFT